MTFLCSPYERDIVSFLNIDSFVSAFIMRLNQAYLPSISWQYKKLNCKKFDSAITEHVQLQKKLNLGKYSFCCIIHKDTPNIDATILFSVR